MSDPNMQLMRAMAAQYPDDPSVQQFLGTAEAVINKARLEKIATEVLAGMFADQQCAEMQPQRYAECAVAYARALIAELDKEAP